LDRDQRRRTRRRHLCRPAHTATAQRARCRRSNPKRTTLHERRMKAFARCTDLSRGSQSKRTPNRRHHCRGTPTTTGRIKPKLESDDCTARHATTTTTTTTHASHAQSRCTYVGSLSHTLSPSSSYKVAPHALVPLQEPDLGLGQFKLDASVPSLQDQPYPVNPFSDGMSAFWEQPTTANSVESPRASTRTRMRDLSFRR
jgi:hypothetical protein